MGSFSLIIFMFLMKRELKRQLINRNYTHLFAHVYGKQEFRRTDFVSRLLAAEGEGGGGQ